MTAQTAQRAPRKRTNKPSEAALREQAATAKEEATAKAQAEKVAAAEALVEAEKVASEPREATLSERQNRIVNDYRSAEKVAFESKHEANVHAVAYFRTLPETVTVTTAKSSQTKPVSARSRAEATIEALCVKVERGANGKVTKGLDTLGYTVQRLTQLVDAFRNAEIASALVRVEEIASALTAETVEGVPAPVVPDAKVVESLVSTLDQARVEGGVKAAEALASSIRETVAETVEAEGGDAGDPLTLALTEATDGVQKIRDGKAAQTKVTPKVETASQKVNKALTALTEVLEAEAQNLDEGQKSALLAKVEALTLFLK